MDILLLLLQLHFTTHRYYNYLLKSGKILLNSKQKQGFSADRPQTVHGRREGKQEQERGLDFSP